MLQELVDRYDLAAGAHLQLWLRGADETHNAEVGIADFSASSGAGAQGRLEIEWAE
jgi:hypothetical protein